LHRALPLASLEALVSEAEGLGRVRDRLVAPVDMLPQLPIFRVTAEDVSKVAHGLPLPAHLETPGRVRVVGPQGSLLAVADVRDGRLAYLRVLAQTT